MFRSVCAYWLLVVCLKMAAVLNMADHLNHIPTHLEEYEPAEETQHTFCKIATEELQATANATIIRELRGVCTSKELKHSMNAIMREILILKDALILQAQVGHGANERKRAKRKNLLDLFAISQDVDENQLRSTDGESYYWTITDVEQYLHDGVSLKSPVISFLDLHYYLKLTIADHIVSIHLERDTEQFVEVTYAIFVLSKLGASDLRIDKSNAYSVTLRRLRQFKRPAGTLFIKLVIE